MIQDKITTGSYDLNNWLNGGYESGIITLLYGPSASGKSNFVILSACHNAQKNKKIIFIDTEGSFSVDRVHQISNGNSEILKNIVILKPTSFSEQKKIFSKLHKELKESKNIGLIIVDSMTMLYRLDLAEARRNSLAEIQEVNFYLSEQMKFLNEIARKKNIPVIVTGQVYSDFLTTEEVSSGKQSGVNVVGGDLLKYWSKCIIELQYNKGKRIAIIKKHRSLKEDYINFDIIKEGVKKRGWF